MKKKDDQGESAEQAESSGQKEESAAAPVSRYEKERNQFRALVLANPNYFGNLKVSPFQPALNIQSNTTYEEIGCVGFQPKFNRLDAVVYVKQPSGYGGGVCSDGTPEYVRFYLSFDNGATWVDQGLTSFQAYNIPEGTSGVKRLEYAVSLQVNPPKKFCFVKNLAIARAILSWNVPPPPNDPDFIPVWGNVHDTRIQIAPRRLIILDDLLQALKVKVTPALNAALDLKQEFPGAEPKSLGLAELKALYKGKAVPEHRFALAEIQRAVKQPMVFDSLMAQGFQGAFPELDIDLTKIVDILFPSDGNTSYEELECIGLNTNQDTLVGVIRVKLPSGYLGGTCTAGSAEYVTFWADFNNNGTFETCLGTASVKVFDIDNIPKEGLEYSVSLPIDLTQHRQPCIDGPKVVRIRAILSWQVAPPCNNPNYVPVWGNREETLIHITPGPKIDGVVPLISILGGIPVGKINNFTGMITSDAVFADNNLPPDALGRACPFGGRVNVRGPQYDGFKYHVQARKVGEVAWTTLTTSLKVVDLNGDVSDHFPDASGKFTYLPFNQNIANLLALWDTSGDDLWQVRIQIFDLFDNLQPGVDTHRLQLDNTAPVASLVIESGVGNCGKFNVGEVLSGHFVARDDHFGSYSLAVKPSINDPGEGIPSPASGVTQTASAPGDAWTLDTTGMDPCGYIIEVVATDRAILNSASVGHHTSASAGFCLEEVAEG